jgi:outer membrane protein assembly factor BamB
VSLQKVPKAAWAALGALALTFVVAFMVGCGSSSSSGDELSFSGAGYPGIDAASTRHAKGSSIDSGSVTGLEEAWTIPATAQSSYGAFSSSPVVSEGVVYMQDLESNVQAIDLESGDVLWEKKYQDPTQGPNGISVGDGRVYGATANGAFALDQETGKELWLTEITRRQESIDMPVAYNDGLVYVSTVPTNVTSTYPAGGVGTLFALDAKTGKESWTFDTVPPGLWGDPSVNAGGGLWYEPTFDGTGSMYFGTGNPVPFPGTPSKPWGSSRPGANLYTNSIVKLDAITGSLAWHYQQTPHDVYDWDFQDPPMLVTSRGRELAIGAGKSGFVVAVGTGSGKPVWKRAVGKHNGHDEDGLLAMRGEYEKLKPGSTVYPGKLGGVIAPMATDGKTVFVPVVNHSMTIVSGSELGEGEDMTGEIVALDVATGKEKWSHELPSAAFSAPVVVNDVVFAGSYDGSLVALDTASGGELWVESLPAGLNAGLIVSGDTLLAPAGAAVAEGQAPGLVAYRLAE